MLLGAHLSIAGGVHNALHRAAGYGFDTLALFVRNQRQWRSPPLTDAQAREFRRVRRRLGVGPIVAHGSYLVNLAGADEAMRRRSIDAVAEELDRCGRLGVEYYVLHPGSNEDAAAGVARIAAGLDEALAACGRRRVRVLLETTAGQGNGIGRRFEQLAEILSRVRRPGRYGVCLDTCHVFAAGYDIRSPAGYASMMDALDDVVGLDRLLAVHLNDSLRPLGSRVDRHAHVGRGEIGRRGLANVVNDPRLADTPLILETPKGVDERGRDWDAVNAAAVRSLIRRAPGPSGAP